MLGYKCKNDRYVEKKNFEKGSVEFFLGNAREHKAIFQICFLIFFDSISLILMKKGLINARYGSSTTLWPAIFGLNLQKQILSLNLHNSPGFFACRNMQQSCSICFHKFNNSLYYPLTICRQQHIICISCKLKISSQTDEPKCPFCRASIPNKNIFGNKFFEQCNNRVEELSKKCEIEKQGCVSEFVDAINDLLSFQTKDSQFQEVCHLTDLIEDTIELLSFKSAKKMLKRYLQQYPKRFGWLVGLGSKVELTFYGRSDNADYWNRYYGRMSLCDSLAVCCLYESTYEEDKEWYKKMIAKHPSLYQAVFGLAVLEHNYGNKVEAQRLYEQAIEIEASCSKAYEMLAFLHFPSNKSKQYAMESFAIKDRFNVFTDYFLAMCGQGDKLEQLTEVVDKYPAYMQPYYNLCRLKQISGKLSQAFAGYLIYFDSCINAIRLFNFFDLLSCLQTFKLQNEPEQIISHKPFGCSSKSLYKQALPLLMKMLEKHENTLNKRSRDKIIFWICKCHAKIGNIVIAAKWMNIFSRDTTCRLDYLQIWIQMYFEQFKYKQIVSTFEDNAKKNVSFGSYGMQSKKRIVLSYVEAEKYDVAIQLAEKDVRKNKKWIQLNLLEEIKKRKQKIVPKKFKNLSFDCLSISQAGEQSILQQILSQQ